MHYTLDLANLRINELLNYAETVLAIYIDYHAHLVLSFTIAAIVYRLGQRIFNPLGGVRLPVAAFRKFSLFATKKNQFFSVTLKIRIYETPERGNL